MRQPPPLDAVQRGVELLAPPGRAFPKEPGTVQSGIFGVQADALLAVRTLALDLLNAEADPFYTEQLLPDFELDYGLPDPCSPANSTINQRRASLLAKMAAIGGQSIAYFTEVAASLGYAITVTEYSPADTSTCSPSNSAPMNAGWKFAWTVNAPGIVVEYSSPSTSSANDPFWTISSTELACRLNAIKPAHTVLLFNYG